MPAVTPPVGRGYPVLAFSFLRLGEDSLAVTRAELMERIRKAVDVEPLDRRAALAIAERLERPSEELLEPLLEAAQELGVRGHGRTITVSLNVFIPIEHMSYIFPFSRFLDLVAEFSICFVRGNKSDQ